MLKVSATAPCPCGSLTEYAACCGRWHGGEVAPTAEALMRSRYVAFVLENEAYLLTTWHHDKRPESVSFEHSIKWLGLKVVAVNEIGMDTAEVEFVARYRLGGGSAERLHERSRFVREAGCWLYVEGKLLAVT
ncbi:MAG: YchJ family protein [Steroidobacteraceae bacterium]